jgi:hypothetical protein
MSDQGKHGVVVPPNRAEVAQKAYLNFIDKLELEAASTENDNHNVSADIVSQIMNADSMEEVTAIQSRGMPSAKNDMQDIEMAITDFSVHVGDPDFEENSLGYYLMIEAYRLEDGEPLRFSVGSANIVASLWKARELGQLPYECVIYSKKAKGPLFIKPIAKRAVKA